MYIYIYVYIRIYFLCPHIPHNPNPTKAIYAVFAKLASNNRRTAGWERPTSTISELSSHCHMYMPRQEREEDPNNVALRLHDQRIHLPTPTYTYTEKYLTFFEKLIFPKGCGAVVVWS